MSMIFRSTRPDELDRVRAFLASVFGVTQSAASLIEGALDEASMRWRFHEPRPDWNGSRSYVIERGGEFVAHGCVWPMPMVLDGRAVTACQIIDWAGSRGFPGAGLLLRRKIEEMVDVSFGVGGSEASRKVMPRAGYAVAAQSQRFVRVVRPWRQMSVREDSAAWKRFAKAVRNLALTPLAKVPRFAGWSVEPSHGDELVDFLSKCPVARVTSWVVLQDGRAAGTFLLSEVHGQARIADISVARPGGWVPVVALASRHAASLNDVCEIVSETTLPVFASALVECGYRECGVQPVFLKDPKGLLAGRELHLTASDYDAFFSWYPKGHFAG